MKIYTIHNKHKILDFQLFLYYTYIINYANMRIVESMTAGKQLTRG